MSQWPIGVFASIDAGLGVHLDVVRELKIPTIQLHAPRKQSRTKEVADRFVAQCADAGIAITCVFCGFEGESYADIATCTRTVGLVPPDTQAARVAEMKEISDFSKLLGCNVLGLHCGFISEETDCNSYQTLVTVMRDLLDHLKKNGQTLHLETGQATADQLLHFIAAVDRNNLFINFDAANMILYGT
eukprot:Selendium_serpulae@DN6030_c17_g2_i1.p1